ncbi:Replication protein A DNA-binding subunit [Armadillidium nasatum]|uniref:Replication protein A subunit n=1 Tax=Armadillidium nasatum TaxID=96803 RepID=A0A5N5SSI8_9CRUS|nr:Replication protein A DNA-binding subunit [Armadillidium nasatum]
MMIRYYRKSIIDNFSTSKNIDDTLSSSLIPFKVSSWSDQFCYETVNFQAATMCAQLTIGGIHRVFNDDYVDSPIFQVLAITNIQSENLHCMVGTQLNWIVENLKPYSKIRVNRYVCKNIKENIKVLIILDLDVLQIGREDTGVIGNPTQYETSLQQGVSGNTTSNNSQQNSMETSTMEFDQPVSVQNGVENKSIIGNLSQVEISQQEGVSANTTSNNSQVSRETLKEEFSQPGPSTAPQYSSFAVGSSGSTSEVFPISRLTPKRNRWAILARVTHKSDIIPYKNNFREGVRFFIDLIDESGEIRATAFNEFCRKFYDHIETNCVYYITQSELNRTNKLYYSPNKDLEMIFDYRTEVRLCEMKTNIPYRMKFQFVRIDEIENIELGKFIDVIAICKNVDEISMTGNNIKKRDIQIVDYSGVEILLTLWDKQADGFDDYQNSVIVVKGAAVKEYNGRYLSVSSSSIVQINPDIEESHKLRKWYEEVRCNLQAENHSQMERSGEGMRNDLKMVGEVLALAENLENGGREYCFVKATIIHLNKNNCMYKACPSNGCNKKVEMNDGVYFCERCQENYDSFNWKYVLKTTIADGTDSVLVTLFQDEAESLLGCTAVTLEAMMERDEDAYYATLDFVLYREYIFELMVKMDLYRGERNLNTIVKSVQPLNYRDYNNVLLNQLE